MQYGRLTQSSQLSILRQYDSMVPRDWLCMTTADAGAMCLSFMGIGVTVHGRM